MPRTLKFLYLKNLEKNPREKSSCNHGLIEKKGRDVALKFVEFEKNDAEDFLEGEEKDRSGVYGGINGNGEWVWSQYFDRLKKLGDFTAATHYEGGYCRPYIDFGISEIHQKYYFVIG